MNRTRLSGLGSMLLGLCWCANVLAFANLGTVFTAISVGGGLALAFVGFTQFRRPESFATDEPPSTRRKVAVFGLAAAAFVGGWVYALA